MKANLYVGTAFTAVAMATAYAFVTPSAMLAAEEASLLAGTVVSSTGEALAGIPIKAHRDNSPITVAVYTDAKGEYSFPTWSDLTPGSYSVGIELPDFEHTAKPVAVSEGKAAKINFTLKSKPLAYEDATNSEIIAGLPGTDQQKVLFSQCGNCHSLQWALAVARTKEDWVRVIKKMAGRAAEEVTPGTYAFSQLQFIEPLADYLVSIRGPDSSVKIPFKHQVVSEGVTGYEYPEVLTALQENKAVMALQWNAAAPTVLDGSKTPDWQSHDDIWKELESLEAGKK